MSDPKKFQYNKIVEFIIKEETNLKSLASSFKHMQDFEKKNIESINDFTKEVQEIGSKLTNKQLAKLITSFSIQQSQRGQSESNIALINDKFNYWLTSSLQKLKSLQEKSKRMELMKQSITSKEIDDFKAELTTQILQINRLEQSIINLYCHNVIKNNSLNLEEITSKMQNELERSKSNMKK